MNKKRVDRLLKAKTFICSPSMVYVGYISCNFWLIKECLRKILKV